MNADVDALYPGLSALAKSRGKTLNELAKFATSKRDGYLSFADCCWFVFNELPRCRSGDPCNYLATFDKYVNTFGPTSKKWKRLFSGPSSTFLDTLVEAAWALFFKDKGFTVRLEERFDPSDQGSKDADLVVTIEGKQWWLDVLSIGANTPKASTISSDMPSLGRRSIDAVVDDLVCRVRKKYNEKFKDAIRAGLLDGLSVGILLCVFKKEPSVIPQLISELSNGEELEPPSSLFDRLRGLDLVWVHTLRPQEGSDVLQPVPLCRWTLNGK
jgi:hypothetical protein